MKRGAPPQQIGPLREQFRVTQLSPQDTRGPASRGPWRDERWDRTYVACPAAMITYLTRNPPMRIKAETRAVMPGAAFLAPPVNCSTSGATIPTTTAPSQNVRP